MEIICFSGLGPDDSPIGFNGVPLGSNCHFAAIKCPG